MITNELKPVVGFYAKKIRSKCFHLEYEDVCQDLWLEISKSLQSYDPDKPRSFKSYIEFKLEWYAKNTIRFHRKRYRLQSQNVMDVEETTHGDIHSYNILCGEIEKEIQRQCNTLKKKQLGDNSIKLFRVMAGLDVMEEQDRGKPRKILFTKAIANHFNLAKTHTQRVQKCIEDATKAVLNGKRPKIQS